MIRIKWIEPNHKFWAQERDGRNLTFFCHADSEQELRQRLEARNLMVQKIEKYDFDEWKLRAAKAKQKAIDAHNAGKRPIKFNPSIWAELKWHLFDLFHGKCAYCESKPQAVSTGDVEHYRPKAKVKEDPRGSNDDGHPGYYWLAYDVTNLLPSCESCNRNFGKMNRFPVTGRHARDEHNLSSEEPLLLHPYDRNINPLEHLRFDELGAAVTHGNSIHGTSSITCYHLNRADLGEPRRTAIQEVRQDWNTFILRFAGLGSGFVSQALFDELRVGIRAYSAAQLCELERITQKGGV